MGKTYFLINVLGKDGYSFLVHGDFDSDEQAIDNAFEAGLFNDKADADCAIAEEADDNDIKQFTDWGCCYEL